MAIKLEDIPSALGDLVRGWVSCCAQCGTVFIGRKDADFCGNACRQAAHRRKADLGDKA